MSGILSSILVLLTDIFVWALLFRPFFRNKKGFTTSAWLALAGFLLYPKWVWEGEIETKVWPALKFYLWIAVGFIPGGLVKVLLS